MFLICSYFQAAIILIAVVVHLGLFVLFNIVFLNMSTVAIFLECPLRDIEVGYNFFPLPPPKVTEIQSELLSKRGQLHSTRSVLFEGFENDIQSTACCQ